MNFTFISTPDQTKQPPLSNAMLTLFLIIICWLQMWCGGVCSAIVWIKNRNSEMSVYVVQSVWVACFWRRKWRKFGIFMLSGGASNQLTIAQEVDERKLNLPSKGCGKKTFIIWRIHTRTWHSNHMPRPGACGWVARTFPVCSADRDWSVIKGWDTKLSDER